ncbi:hypothetical protein R6Q59_010160 [Mikania micrantha]
MENTPAVQLSFQLRTSLNVRSVHLLGSWDNYKRQLPLSMLKDASAKPGSWKGTFRFQGPQGLKLGSRYWYYYIIDGYHVSHDPAKEFVTEKTTGRKLNVLDIPAGSNKASKSASKPGLTVQTHNIQSKRYSREIAQGRPMSPTRIVCPKPQKPYASQQLREADYEVSPIDDLEERFAASRISNRSSRSYSSSPLSDCSSSGSEFSDISTPASSSSRISSSNECRCGRFGVTRDGRRVKLDCGGKRCAYAESSYSDCSTSESEDESPDARRRIQVPVKKSIRTTQGKPVIVTRHP